MTSDDLQRNQWLNTIPKAYLPALFEFGEDELGQFFQRFEHAHALNGYAFEDRLTLFLKLFGQLRHGHGIRQVALVQLQDVGNRCKIQVVLFQVFLQVLHGLEIGIQPLFLRICDEDDTIGALQDELAAGFVEHLSGHSVEVEPGLEAANRAQVERKKIEEESAVGLGGQGNHFPFLVLAGVVVDPLQVGGLSAQTWTVVHQLAINFARGKIDERHLSLAGPWSGTCLEIYSTRVTGRPPFQLDGCRVFATRI